MFELIVQSGKHQGKCLQLPSEGEVIIGRDELCQIRLASSDVSRHHCVLKMTAEGIVARDLDSRNGTYLNETLMEEETLLKPGDMLRIGPIILQVPGAPAAPVRAASDDDIASWLSTNENIAATDGDGGGLRRYDHHSSARSPRRSAPCPGGSRQSRSAAPFPQRRRRGG